MGATVDHLQTGQRIVVVRDFSDATGRVMQAGEAGTIRSLTIDPTQLEVLMELARETENVRLTFKIGATSGPRNGHMQEYFQVKDSVRSDHELAKNWQPVALILEGPDRLDEIEEAMKRSIPHIGAAASIAEMYAQRMREFRRLGNEQRAIAAFRLSVEWIETYASWATSGGEGAALSSERDRFHAALVKEFGYDPR
jgi:hypothetical protein